MQDHLIDNATLSGVQRLLGESQTLNLYNIDNDICCFEKVVSAILFGERLLYLDDYKEEFRASRYKTFEFMEAVQPEGVPYRELSEEAARFAAETAFAFKGSKPVGDALAFFQTIKVDPQMRWDIFVSSEYLTLSYLVSEGEKEYPSKINAAIGNEEGDRLRSASQHHAQPMLVVNGKEIDGVKEFLSIYANRNPNSAGSNKNTLEKLVFGYGWVAERSYLYSSIAAHLNASCTLSPLRDAFCETSYRIDHTNELDFLVKELSQKSQIALAQIVGPMGDAKYALRLPFFTAYLLSRCENVREAIHLAFELRNQPTFRAFRGILSNLQHLGRSERVAEVQGLMRYLDQEASQLLKEYCVETGQGPSVGVSVGFSGLSVDIGGRLQSLFRHYKNAPFGKIFRSMANDLIAVERLGPLHDKASLLVRKHADAKYPKSSTTPKFMEKRSSKHGRPADPEDAGI